MAFFLTVDSSSDSRELIEGVFDGTIARRNIIKMFTSIQNILPSEPGQVCQW